MPKYQIIVEDLRKAILNGKYAPGSRIPSIRQLSERYGVSQITVLRVFKELSQDGLIIKRDGTGYITSDRTVSVSGNTFIFAVRSPREVSPIDNFQLRVFEGMMTTALEHGYNLYFPKTIISLRHQPINENHMRNLLEEISQVKSPRGVIFDMLYPDEMIGKYFLPECNLPCVIAGRSSVLPVRYVTLPFEKCVREVFRLALISQAKKFFIFEHTHPWGGNHNMCCIFADLLKEHGIADSQIICRRGILESLKHDQELLEELRKTITMNAEKVFIFSTSDYFSRSIMDKLHKECHFGKRASLVSFGGFEFMQNYNPPVTSIVPDARELGVKSIELLEQNPLYSNEHLIDYQVTLNATL